MAVMQVELVSAERRLWSGEAEMVVARTTEGEIGILPGHAPLLAVLEPSAVVIFCDDGKREVVAVEGGFISVSQGRVSILSEYARLATEMSLRDAERELDAAQQVLDSGDYSDDDKRRFDRANAQLRAAQKAQ
jgi:F-type H+-transporting ATPase subunit epsilon